MVVVGANMGVSRVTREHIGVAVALKLPMIIVITKTDIAPKEIFDKTLTTLNKIIRGTFCNMTPALMKS
jgi:GTPase